MSAERYCSIKRGHSCSLSELSEECFWTPEFERPANCREHIARAESGSAPETSAEPARETAPTVVEAVRRVVRRITPSNPQVTALQDAILAAGCQLPRYGADGKWGAETEAGVRCLAARQGWSSVAQNYPLVAQRMTIPVTESNVQQVVAKQAFDTAVETATQVSTASIGPSIRVEGLPMWAHWAIGGGIAVGLVALGAFLTRERDDV